MGVIKYKIAIAGVRCQGVGCREKINYLGFINYSAYLLTYYLLPTTYYPLPNYIDYEMNSTNNNNQQQSTSPEVYQIPLLEEKLQVARRKVKVGEVIVRKQVETRMVKIPLRREKLIVERIGKNPELLTEVIIGEEKVNGFKYEDLDDTENLDITKSSFLELSTAQELLEAMTQLSLMGNTRVRLEIVSSCSEQQTKYQDICDRFQ